MKETKKPSVAPIIGAIMPSIEDLKKYAGPATHVRIPGVGAFELSEDAEADNGGTIIIDKTML